MREEWKDIVGYEGLYQVSNIGRVRSLDRVSTTKNGVTRKYNGKLLIGGMYSNGYKFVSLRPKLNGQCTYLIHRLVASAFIPNPNNFTQVNHINTIRTDNAVTNLEWVTPSENMLHARTVGDAKFCYIEKQVIAVNENTNETLFFKNTMDACTYFGHTKSWLGNKKRRNKADFVIRDGWVIK